MHLDEDFEALVSIDELSKQKEIVDIKNKQIEKLLIENTILISEKIEL